MPTTRSKRKLQDDINDEKDAVSSKKPCGTSQNNMQTTNIKDDLKRDDSNDDSYDDGDDDSSGDSDDDSDDGSGDSDDDGSGDESYTYSDQENHTDHERMLEKIKAVDNVAYTKMKDVLEIINSKNPDIMSILKAPMRSKDRATIVELYEVFKITNPLTEDWLELRYKLNFFIKKFEENYTEYSKYSKQELDMIKTKSKDIRKEIMPDFAVKYEILTLDTSDSNKAAIYKKYRQFKKANPHDEERVKLKSWIDCALGLPHNKTIDMVNTLSTGPSGGNKFTKFLENVTASLDSELYGMKYVKEQLLLFLNSKLTNPNMKGCSLALVGPPGVGKTTIARHLADVMKWPFEQISFGGVNSADFLKGHDYTYIGSKPGEIVRCLSRMKYKNGILFLDEYEKVSENKDIASCLLHVTDFQQNHEFRDNYLSDIKIDLSQLWFIYSMNELPVDTALRDRLFVINVPAYTQSEKSKILKDFVIPKTLRNINQDPYAITMGDAVAQQIVNVSSPDGAGIRRIEQVAKDLVNKINFIVMNQDTDGNLPDVFNFMSFSTDESEKIGKLTLPIELTIELFDILFKSVKAKSALPFGMYT